jgi:hypothetical protein
MNPTFRSVETLLACRLLTRDGTEAGLTDLILDVEQLIRADTLRGMLAETVDGSLLRIRDLLIDDSDWSLAYLDLLRADGPGSRGGQGEALRCLLGRNGIDWLNRRAQTLHLAVWMQELRKAPAGRLPVAGGADTPVRILTPEA